MTPEPPRVEPSATLGALLLATRLLPPPARPGLIRRPRLAARLEDSPTTRLVLVSAAAACRDTGRRGPMRVCACPFPLHSWKGPSDS